MTKDFGGRSGEYVKVRAHYDDLAKRTMRTWLDGVFTVEELGPDDHAVGEPRKDILYDVPLVILEILEIIWKAAFERGRAQEMVDSGNLRIGG